jgi:hypothetical protein
VARAGGLKVLWLTWFSKPAGDRPLFRAIRRRCPRRIMLLGLSNIDRALQIISLAQRYHPRDDLELVGIDPFETRSASLPRLPLKEAHRLLRATGARINLVPGSAAEALARSANSLRGFNLVLIGADQDDAALANAWFYLPRTLGAESLVLRESIAAEGPTLSQIELAELQRRASRTVPSRRAA